MFANSAITIYNINYVLFKDKKNNDGEAIWPNSSRTRISTQGYKTALLTRPLCQPVQTDVIPPFSPQAHLTFHQPTLHPRTLHHLQYTAPQLPHPLPNIHTLHSEDLQGVHPLPIQSLRETSANSFTLPCSSFTVTRSPHFCSTCSQAHTSIMSPKRCLRKADIIFLLWTSRQAQAVMDKPPPCPVSTPGMMSWPVQRRHLEPRKLTD